MNPCIKRAVRKISKKIPFLNRYYHSLSTEKTHKLKDLSDEDFLRRKYKESRGEELNLENPEKISDKLQWIKMYDHQPIYTTMADKYRSKAYVKETIGEEYIVPTYGAWKSFEEIDFNALPEKFVLKCNHDCGSVIICKDKNTLDKTSASQKLNGALKSNYYYVGREWPYKNIDPLIFAEMLLEDENGGEIMDYKFWCFNGEPKFIHLASARNNNQVCVTFFDLNWERLPFHRLNYKPDKREIPKPSNLEKMTELARALSQNTLFLRVDLYNVNNKIYVGELTFFPGGGMDIIEPREWETTLGNWINLEQHKQGDGVC